MCIRIFFWLALVLSFICQAQPALKLPFPGGDTWVATRTYNVATHINYGAWMDDRYAIDFVENGCASINKPILAAADGTVEVQPFGASYGNCILINHGGGYKTRYGHMDRLLVVNGASVIQGQPIGIIGNTGSVSGTACKDKPGMHLHFVLYYNGVGVKAEPMSGYASFIAGSSYRSDNYPAYLYDDNGYTCKGPITGGANTNWDYTGTTKTATFNEGETAYALLKITTIRKDHRFQARASKDGVVQWSWNTEWNRVGTGWDKAYFFPGIQNIIAGNWKLETLIDVGAGFKPLDVFNITAVRGGTSTSKYTYDQNAFVCTGPITGGAVTNWEYNGTQRRVNFNKGDTAYVVAKVTNVKANHQFRIAAYKNGVYQWQWDTGWNNVGAGWDKAYFWAEFYNLQPGNWEARLSINVGNGFEEFDRESFTVSSSSPNYRFDDNGFTTLGPINAGTAANDWVYSSAKPAQTTFDPGPAVHLLVRFNDLKVSHRFKVETYKNGTYQWLYETPWNTVNPGEPWKWAYFTRSLFVASTGSWQFRVFIDDGAGYRQVKTLNFTVR